MPPASKQQKKAERIRRRKEAAEKRKKKFQNLWQAIKRGGTKMSESEFFKVILPQIAGEAAGALGSKYIGDEGGDFARDFIKKTTRDLTRKDGDDTEERKLKDKLADEALESVKGGYTRHHGLKSINDEEAHDKALREHRGQSLKDLAQLYHHHSKLYDPKPAVMPQPGRMPGLIGGQKRIPPPIPTRPKVIPPRPKAIPSNSQG